MDLPNYKFLIYGATGWIGGKMVSLLKEKNYDVSMASARIENRNEIIMDLEKYKPTHVINCAGITGKPNVDWCETNQIETIRVNVIGTLNVAELCLASNIHCTIFGTGCIYQYNNDHLQTYTEEDIPNFSGSFYSKTKIMVEQLLKSYHNVCLLRLRMPISDDLHERNFITKITKYKKVINVPNSVSILHDLLPAAIILARKGITGIYNFTNPGSISHNEILDKYQRNIDPNFKYENFSVEEQDKILKAKRSNNELDVSKLVLVLGNEYQIPHVQNSIEQVFKRMKANLTIP